MSVKFLSQNQVYDTEVCLKNLNLLAHAQIIELETGSQCGGHGVCGADRIAVSPEESAKLNPLTEIEKRLLSPPDQARGIRLACQCFPNQDGLSLNIDILLQKA